MGDRPKGRPPKRQTPWKADPLEGRPPRRQTPWKADPLEGRPPGRQTAQKADPLEGRPPGRLSPWKAEPPGGVTVILAGKRQTPCGETDACENMTFLATRSVNRLTHLRVACGKLFDSPIEFFCANEINPASTTLKVWTHRAARGKLQRCWLTLGLTPGKNHHWLVLAAAAAADAWRLVWAPLKARLCFYI